MRIVYLGNNDRGVRCLEALLAAGRDVAGVVALPDPPVRPWFASVKETALAAGLPVIQPAKVDAEIDTLRKWRPDLLVLVGYTQIIRRDLIDVAPMGAINLHGGKLPEYRGASVMNWQIINGETEAGVAILRVDEGVDTGEILAQERFPLGPDDTIADLLTETLERFPRMLLDVLNRMGAGTLKGVRQDPSAGRTWPRRRPEDGRLDWSRMSARDVHNMVRALTRPYPGAFTHLAGRKVFIWKTRVTSELKGKRKGEGESPKTPDAGCVRELTPDGPLVACAQGAVTLADLTDETGNPLVLPVGTLFA